MYHGSTPLRRANSRKRANELWQPEVERLTIDLRAVSFLDSSGVGALLSVYKKLPPDKPSVKLLNVQPPVQTVVELLRLHRIFHHRSLKRAVADQSRYFPGDAPELRQLLDRLFGRARGAAGEIGVRRRNGVPAARGRLWARGGGDFFEQETPRRRSTTTSNFTWC